MLNNVGEKDLRVTMKASEKLSVLMRE